MKEHIVTREVIGRLTDTWTFILDDTNKAVEARMNLIARANMHELVRDKLLLDLLENFHGQTLVSVKHELIYD